MAKTPDKPIIISQVEDRGPGKREKLLDAMIEDHAAALNEHEARVLKTVEQTLGELVEDLRRRQDIAGIADTPTAALLDRTIAEAQALYAQAHNKIYSATIQAQAGAAKARALDIARRMAPVIDVATGVRWMELSASQLEQASSRAFFGWTTQQWNAWHTLEDANKIDRELRAAYFAGDGMEAVADRIMAVTAATETEAMTTATTAIQTASNRAAVESYKANADVLQGVRWVATLDNRTCPQCGPLDGKIYKVGNGPAPPAHPRCRCFLAPEVKRRFLPGKPAEVPTWTDWMSGQYGGLTDAEVAERQRKVLGAGTAKALQSGKIELSDLVTQGGRKRKLPEALAVARKRRRST